METSVSRRRAAGALLAGTLVPGTGHVLVGARSTGIPLTALSGTLLLAVALLVARLASSPLDAIAFGAAADGLGVVGLASALWLVYVAAVAADLLRRLRMRSAASARRRLSLAAVALLVIPAVICSTISASAFTGRGILTSVFGGDTGLEAHDGRYNILVVGADRAPGRSVVQPDSITVVSVDALTGRTAVVGVDRTTQNFPYPAGSVMASQFPSGNRCLSGCNINFTYQYGLEHADLWAGSPDPGLSALTEAVEGYTGLTMSGHVYVELDAFIRLIDALGGVTVDVKAEVPRIGVPDIGSDQLSVVGPPIEPGVQHMDGETALWFARSRYASSNSDRMQRQSCIQQALLKQLDPGTALSVFLSLAGTTEGLSTDLSPEALGTLAALADGARSQPLDRVELTKPLVQPLQPDLDVVASALRSALHPGEDGEESTSPTAPPAPLSGGLSAPVSPGAGGDDAPSAEPLCSVP
ncbi:LCP family protein [Cnuibacter physcomitrellae]|uniref:LCP family protein n=1 Tax=Cnuibacter physcomitrellae TaxID=1619308 RepID=UPI00157E1561|nr:LCP family protein [Cnuibacter physcomitrellae]